MSEFGLSRQPDKLDYASPTQFRFIINQIPKVAFFSVAANVPAITLGEAIFPTPFRQVPIAGDELTYDSFTISFLVDEYLENYITLHDWSVGHGFHRTRTEFSNFRDNVAVEEALTSTAGSRTTGKAVSDRVMSSDSTLTILSNKNNPIVEVNFQNIFPTSLSALDFSQAATDVEYMVATAEFAYQIYEIITL